LFSLVAVVSYHHFWVLVVWKIADVEAWGLGDGGEAWGLGDGGGVGFDGGGDGG